MRDGVCVVMRLLSQRCAICPVDDTLQSATPADRNEEMLAPHRSTDTRQVYIRDVET